MENSTSVRSVKSRGLRESERVGKQNGPRGAALLDVVAGAGVLIREHALDVPPNGRLWG